MLGSLHVPSGLGHDVVGGVDAARDAAALCSGTATRLVQGVLDGAGAVLLGMLPPRAPYGDEKVANREIRVWRGATEKAP